MATRNSDLSFGGITRFFHWTTAALIFLAFPLGLYANDLPFDTAEELAWKAQVFSVHKTIGVAVFFLAFFRILWAFAEVRPAPLHPEKTLEVRVAESVHWALYISLVVVPLSGWVHHAAVTGFAPILWPFGQGLPLVPKSDALGAFAGGLHWIFTKILAISVILHIAGAVKHHLIDQDHTLRRMVTGTAAPAVARYPAKSALPLIGALLVFASAFGFVALTITKASAPEIVAETALPVQPVLGNWEVTEGSLTLTVKQMGQDVTGSFGAWSAEIQFDETPVDGKNGTVTVTIDTASLSLGSVTDQAKGHDFFNVTTFPQALFQADILATETGYLAKGHLTLRGMTMPVDLPFTLQIDGGRATMAGSAVVDRRDFDMGAAYGDESSVGFPVGVSVNLVAIRR